MKPWLKYALWITALVIILVVLYVANYKHQESLCEYVLIEIDYRGADILMTDDDVSLYLSQHQSPIIGKKLSETDLEQTEKLIMQMPMVKEVEAFSTLNSEVIIRIKQRRPVMKVFNKTGQMYYVDDEGKMLLISDRYQSRIIVVSGEIPNPFDSNQRLRLTDSLTNDNIHAYSSLERLLHVALKIEKDSFASTLIHQLYMNDRGEIEMIPLVGDQIILLGKGAYTAEKLQKMRIFYTEASSKFDLGKYRVINLKFKNQVVCIKKEQTDE